MTANQPANWYPDPTGSADYRYWDGTEWTDQVSRGGVQATDPVDAAAQSTATIEILATFFPLAFLLFFFPPTLVVDGRAMRGTWRQPTRVPVAAGRHTVRVFFRYFGVMDAGVGEIDVEVASGAAQRVTYKAPWLIFLRGRMTVA
jgi:Protein of unknown function (DUF2510)